jgi:Tfp pilus assembly protein PilW
LPAPEQRQRGITLVELLISSTLAAIILTAVLGMFLFLARSSANIINYAEMEAQARQGLEYFAQDTRQASDLVWNSANSITLTVNGVSITYAYNSGNGTFTRTLGSSTTTLIEGISSFTYSGYMITGATVDLSDLSTAAKRTSASEVTKQVQLYVLASRTTTTVTTATNTVLSARYILRNKRVTA